LDADSQVERLEDFEDFILQEEDNSDKWLSLLTSELSASIALEVDNDNLVEVFESFGNLILRGVIVVGNLDLSLSLLVSELSTSFALELVTVV
ncbi:8828_t:CDS:1, partial [Racocetra fulgida]